MIHDNAQISQWLTFEQERVLTSELNLKNRGQQYLILQNKNITNNEKGVVEIENQIVLANKSENENQRNSSLTLQNSPPNLLESMSKLQREMTVRSQKLLAAEEEEEVARKVRNDSTSTILMHQINNPFFHPV